MHREGINTRIDENDGGFWEYVYDGRDRLTEADYTTAWGHVTKYRYTYDDGDNMTQKQEPFSEDFNDGNYTGWTLFRTWSATDGYMTDTHADTAYIRTARTEADAEIRFSYYSGDTSSTGYYLSASLRYELSPANRLELQFFPNKAQLLEQINGGSWTVEDDNTAATTTQDTWYDVVAKLDGANVTVWRGPKGGELQEILSTTSTATTATETLQFFVAANAEYRLDDIKIIDGVKLSTWAMTCNDANELTQMSNSAQGTTINYAYDAWGRRSKKNPALLLLNIPTLMMECSLPRSRIYPWKRPL